jgi:hypothetical protein
MQYFIEPNEFDGRMGVIGELIIKLPTYQEEALWDIAPVAKQGNIFFIIGFAAFLFLITMFDLMKHYPEELDLMGRFLDEMYGHEQYNEMLEDLNAGLEQEVKLEEPSRELEPKLKLYEDKYKESFDKLELRELTQEELKMFANNRVMEYTPVGNVIMTYNVEKGSFEYYSDSIVPYRYLNVVGRKYVCIFDCVALMRQPVKELCQPLSLAPVSIPTEEPKKNVYAKFKTYNNGSATPHSSAEQPSKRSRIEPSKVVDTTRYTSCGKIANMQMLQKVDRKQIDKTYAMSFAEYKKQMESSKRV